MVQASVARFREELASLADPARAAQEKRYLKSPFQFYGVAVPRLRAMAGRFRRENRRLPKEALWELCWTLWRSGFHEERSLAMLLLERYGGLLDITDMPALEQMLRESVNWDQVDAIANGLVAWVLEKDESAFAYLRRWADDPSFWMRRAALLSQARLFRRGGGDRALFYSFARRMLEEREFFIRKAIGWVLRELCATEPAEVLDFVLQNRDRMSGLTFREATRRLPDDLRRRLED